MLKTGLANIGLGIVIALIGIVVTSVTYEMATNGGTYVVTYGAIVVGAWRILLGLSQVLRGAFAGREAAPAALPPSSPITRADARPAPSIQASTIQASSNRRQPDVQPASTALHIVGWALIADAALRVFSLGSLLLHVRAAVIFDSVPFLATVIIVLALLIVGAAAAGALLLRNAPAGIAFGVGLCAAGLLFQGYGLWRMLSFFAYRVPWLPWAYTSIHLTIYVVGLIVLARFLGRRDVAPASFVAPTDAATSPIRRT